MSKKEQEHIYVVVAENDQSDHDDGGPIVFEQYTKDADIESIKKRANGLQRRYGKCRIARLDFVDI